MSETTKPVRDAICKDIFNNAKVGGMPSVLVGGRTWMELSNELEELRWEQVKYSPAADPYGEYKFAGSTIYGLPDARFSGWLVGDDEDIKMLMKLLMAAKDKEIQQFLLHYKP